MSFLEKILPSRGLYIVAIPKGKGFRHYLCDSLKEAELQIEYLDRQGENVYLAQAGFNEAAVKEARAHNKQLPRTLTPEERKAQSKKERSQTNSTYLRSFFFDIDCGADKAEKGEGYATQKLAAEALKRFVAETGLPFPAVVNSGNGLYAHWLIDEDIPADNWKTLARLLKKVSVAYEFISDPMRTADSASVLRPPGTTNRKREEKPVRLIRDMEPVALDSFIKILKRAAKQKQVDTNELAPPSEAKLDMNSDFYSGMEINDIPMDPGKIADKCSQLGRMRETRGNLSEPLWYAGLGVLVFCEGGEKVSHEWSNGHPDYSFDDTARKIAHRRESMTGPTTCAYFATIDAHGCLGCPHANKIKSPIVLGRPEPKQKEIKEEDCPPPPGFRRSDEGLFREAEGDRWEKFYDQDLYPSQIAFDESLGYQVVTLRHHLPHEGWLEFKIRSSVINDTKSLMTALWDNHVIVVGAKEKKAMAIYLEGYLQRLQRQRRMSQLFCQMGWKERRNELMFVLGNKVYHQSGKVESAPLANTAPQAAQAYRCEGEFDTWCEATKVLGAPGMEPFAFAMLAGGFGAPLMKFTGFEGALISLLGDSGIGKTLMLRFAQSVWGYNKELLIRRNDTPNAILNRLGFHGCLPATIDELTNIEGMALSDLVYQITQGRDKARLTKNSEEKRNINQWNTIALTSTNESLVERLAHTKQDASAELNRLFEYTLTQNDALFGPVATQLYWTLNDNYGHAGDRYIRWVVSNVDKVKEELAKVQEKVNALALAKGDERFWSAIAATTIYGGLVAKRLGLIKFEVAPILTWVVDNIRSMRSEKITLASDPVSILGQFLDEFSANRLLVAPSSADKRRCAVILPPRGPLYIRHEVNIQRVFISVDKLKWFLARRYGSYGKLRGHLISIGALTNSSRRKVLGAGTEFSTVPQPCWEIDLKCPALGAIGLQLVEQSETLKEQPLSDEKVYRMKKKQEGE